jgi:hypothetical protein
VAKLITQCPSCDSSPLQITHLACPGCNIRFEGKFELPKLLLLAPEDLLFVEQFLLASGSLKEMAHQLEISYPTVRNRLNHIIEKVQAMRSGPNLSRNDILTALESGQISALEAAKKLRETE